MASTSGSLRESPWYDPGCFNNLRVCWSQNRYPPPDQVQGHAVAEYAL